MAICIFILLVSPLYLCSGFSFYPTLKWFGIQDQPRVSRDLNHDINSNAGVPGPSKAVSETVAKQCRPAEVAELVCKNMVDGWFQPFLKMRRTRRDGYDIQDYDDDDNTDTNEIEMEKRSFSHTSLPLPSRVQFMLKVKRDFCIQVKKRVNKCMKRAVGLP